jgi:hypothetical protein
MVPLAPLKQLTSYMAVVTDRHPRRRGNDATPDQTYFLTKRTAPLCSNGQPAPTRCCRPPPPARSSRCAS